MAGMRKESPGLNVSAAAEQPTTLFFYLSTREEVKKRTQKKGALKKEGILCGRCNMEM